MIDLCERTDIVGFAFFSRGNANDPASPHTVDSGGALEFFPQVLGITVLDALRRFEQWTVTQGEGLYFLNPSVDYVADLSSQLRREE
jgi:hypothetical protein